MAEEIGRGRPTLQGGEGVPNAGEAEALEVFDVGGGELGDAVGAEGEGQGAS